MIDILENKQYITDINSKWTFFKFPNGKEDRVATNIKLTDVLLDYFPIKNAKKSINFLAILKKK